MSKKQSRYPEGPALEEKKDPVNVMPFTPESSDETARKSGLAYSAGLMLGASIIIMLLVGLGLDSYFKTTPILLVICTLIGAVIGFFQFFRATSQIINK
jgi:F0F1-type ATP synthase assembly protein I